MISKGIVIKNRNYWVVVWLRRSYYIQDLCNNDPYSPTWGVGKVADELVKLEGEAAGEVGPGRVLGLSAILRDPEASVRTTACGKLWKRIETQSRVNCWEF